jgi:glycosyltransferase involved in cell wall biosynthesis
MTSLSVIIASSGRLTLQRTLESVQRQMDRDDEILVSVNSNAPWGHAARNQLMRAARGDAIMFLDDDDVYVSGALNIVRRSVELNPYIMHMFRMRYPDGRELWRTTDVSCGNVSTQMVVCPNNQPMLGRFGEGVYEGDYHFIKSSMDRFGQMVWHQEIIALVRPR